MWSFPNFFATVQPHCEGGVGTFTGDVGYMMDNSSGFAENPSRKVSYSIEMLGFRVLASNHLSVRDPHEKFLFLRRGGDITGDVGTGGVVGRGGGCSVEADKWFKPTAPGVPLMPADRLCLF
eukprot:1444079-Rhodomonas_salina.1